MKYLFLSIVFSTALQIALALESSQISAPSDFRMSNTPIPTIRFVSYESEDLRLLFCTPDVLKDRIRRHVCVVDNLASFEEVEIGEGTTIASLMKRASPKTPLTWQLRLIRRDAIEQTPGVNISVDSSKDFRDKIIVPGDFLVITVTD